jgi:hypothetical protein
METNEVLKKHERQFRRSRILIKLLLVLLLILVIILQYQNIAALFSQLLKPA